MTKEFAPLRALVWVKPAPAVVAPLRDPLGDAVTRALVMADLWRSGSTLELEGDGRQVRVRVHLPERSQGDRSQDQEVAQRMRAIIMAALVDEGFGAVFTDALWVERDGRGWAVVARARRLQSASVDQVA
jgi:hypothetical protein